MLCCGDTHEVDWIGQQSPSAGRPLVIVKVDEHIGGAVELSNGFRFANGPRYQFELNALRDEEGDAVTSRRKELLAIKEEDRALLKARAAAEKEAEKEALEAGLPYVGHPHPYALAEGAFKQMTMKADDIGASIDKRTPD